MQIKQPTLFERCEFEVGRYFRSLALLAVFLNWPSDLVVSYLTSPLKSIASTTASAASLILTSSSSPTTTQRGHCIQPFVWPTSFCSEYACVINYMNEIYVKTFPLVSYMFHFNFMTNLALSIYVQSKLITCFPQVSLVLLHYRITRLALFVNEVKGRTSKTGKFLS